MELADVVLLNKMDTVKKQDQGLIEEVRLKKDTGSEQDSRKWSCLASARLTMATVVDIFGV